MKRLLLLCTGIGLLMTGCGGGGPDLPASYGSEEEPIVAIGAAGDRAESTATCILQVNEETEETSYVYYGMTYSGRTVQDYVNAMIQNYDGAVIDTETGYHVAELPAGVGESEPVSPQGEAPVESEEGADAAAETTEETGKESSTEGEEASASQLSASVGDLLSDKNTGGGEPQEETSDTSAEETTEETPTEEETEVELPPYIPVAPTGIFAEPVGTITVAKELSDGINRLEITLQWTETACTVTTEVVKIPPPPSERAETVQALTTSDAVDRIESIVQKQLGLSDEEAAHCNAYAQDGYVMVDGNVCFRVGVYNEIERSILRTYLLSVDGTALYYLDHETQSAIPVTNT